ncbi:tigger transposable element-derived protein 6 [Ceratobasidium sp. AG-Ba]|nr:tigger transposable element-derived protein 6 [Ceratobasidium sp. AG-Ba]
MAFNELTCCSNPAARVEWPSLVTTLNIKSIDAIQRDAASAQNIYSIDPLEAMQLALTAWNKGEVSTIANCWRHTGLAADVPSTGLPEGVKPALQDHFGEHPGPAPEILHPTFQRTLDTLGGSPPTEGEESAAEIAARVEEMEF